MGECKTPFDFIWFYLVISKYTSAIIILQVERNNYPTIRASARVSPAGKCIRFHSIHSPWLESFKEEELKNRLAGWVFNRV